MAFVIINNPTYALYVSTEHVLLLVKVICSAALHLMLYPEIAQSMQIMKYITNHPENFQHQYIVFSIALTAHLINILAEILNIYMLIYQYKVDYCIIHFVALEIIVEIPGIYMSSLIDDKLKDRMFSSHNLAIENKGSEINFWGREFMNKVQRCIYRVNRALYVSAIFYFCPFFVLYVYVNLEPGNFGAAHW